MTTSGTPTPATRRRESKATLFGAALSLLMGGLVTAAALILLVATVALGDTAMQLP
ncbi:hypothetical protein [Agromyces marinus]|uniref:Uncharacterized protein n=1 Tax=Agromyces marinus TaxID=1389020 RepID=A0ABN6YF02_9MICO|nr:hypothetical protein [Agromyces marinus]UIP57275.1 hypothetical protein DSM26151_01300 [Agromyces marinus]BDZ54630.1 hypothetical protein GCM10025870_17030 [Agromyces marinus]